MRNVWIVMGTIFLAMGGVVSAGPLHEAAMDLVRQGEAVSDTGNLDAAMAIYDRVELEFPEEYEAILWARYRKAECLIAGGRFLDAVRETTHLWELIRDGKIADPDALFWGGFLHAKCLERRGGDWMLSLAASDTLQVFDTFLSPDAGKMNAAGWLHYWQGLEFEKKGQWSWALGASESAWNLANDTGDGTLAAWARLLMARSHEGKGNPILARGMLQECREGYLLHEDSVYKAYLEMAQTRMDLELGLLADTRERVLSILADNSIAPPLRMRTLVSYVQRVREEGNLEDAIGPLAIACTAFPHVPVWGPMVLNEWALVWQEIGYYEFPGVLSSLDDPDISTERERQAIRVRLAEELLKRGLGEEVMALCDSFEGLCSDPMFGPSVTLVRARAVRSSTPEEHLSMIEMLLAIHGGDDAMARYLVGLARDELWYRGKPPRSDGTVDLAVRLVREENDPLELRDNLRFNLLIRRKLSELTEGEQTYGDWLQENRALMPATLFRLEISRWLRERHADHEGALMVAAEMLAGGDSLYRNEAHVERIVNLHCLGSFGDAERAVEESCSETLDPGSRDHNLYLAGRALLGESRKGAYSLLMRVGDPSRFGEDTEPAAEIQRFTADALSRIDAFDEAEALVFRLRRRDPEKMTSATQEILDIAAAYRQARNRRGGKSR